MTHPFVEKTGLAMYTVHQSADRDLAGTLTQVAVMGYRGIEFYGAPQREPRMVRDALAQSGLVLTGWHIEWRELQPDRFERTVAYLQEVGCPLAVVPCLGGKWNIAHTPSQENEQTWKAHISWLNETAYRLDQAGIRTGYHNHEHEFQLQYGGKPLFDYLFDQLCEKIVMEFDTGNCIEGGDDPVRVLEKYRGRDIILHLKPFSRQQGFDVVLGDRQDQNNWQTIVNPQRYPFEWCLVESENTRLPELENARLCMEGLRRYLH